MTFDLPIHKVTNFAHVIYLSMLINKVFLKAISGGGRVAGPMKTVTNLY